MVDSQQHIIHKVIIDVEAKSEGAAFRLKDTIDVFLKEEIFPSLERYFESLEEELKSQTIQISQLTLDVNCTSENDFRTLKEAIKKEAIKEFKKAIKSSKGKNENVVFLSSDQSKERALIYFLEKGIPPWWNGTKNDNFLQEKTIVEASNSTSFIKSFREKLQLIEVQDRLINQFSDIQIQNVLYNAFKSDAVEISIVKNDIIEKFKEQTPQIRKLLWKSYINYFLKKEATVFLTELLQYSTSDKGSEFQETRNKETSKIVQLVMLQFEGVLSKEVIIKVLKTPEIYHDKYVENTVEVHESTVEVNEAKIDQDKASNSSKITFKEQQKNRDVENLRVLNKTQEDNDRSEELKEEEGSSFSTEKEKEYLSKSEVKLHSDKELEVKNVVPDLKSTDSTFESKVTPQEEVVSTKNIRESSQKIPNEKVLENQLSPEEERESQSKKASRPIEKLEVQDIEDIDVNIEVVSEKSLLKKQEEIQRQEVTSEKKEVLQKRETKSSSNSQTVQEQKLKEGFDTSLQAEKKHESIEESIENSILETPIQPEENGEYYSQNAGLIIVHPYLKDFLVNCDLLNDENKITNPELAIHLLHYVATKKEKQFESNMVFEKFLCGFPIQKSIRREVGISKELKQKSEDFLEAVITNWTALNNASPDLLRNEFLQRLGKISFKEVNPRIVVERKTHDILLDKIPWTLSICKLPWINKLIFTDW
ncbi:MAG: hypothetical protein JKY02_06970 [Flavobacteriaceae bacterium]|nr:hypothetical protein [Flavobacteriaceae bacterium]